MKVFFPFLPVITSFYRFLPVFTTVRVKRFFPVKTQPYADIGLRSFQGMECYFLEQKEYVPKMSIAYVYNANNPSGRKEKLQR